MGSSTIQTSQSVAAFHTVSAAVPRFQPLTGEHTCFLVAHDVSSILVYHQPSDQTERLWTDELRCAQELLTTEEIKTAVAEFAFNRH